MGAVVGAMVLAAVAVACGDDDSSDGTQGGTDTTDGSGAAGELDRDAHLRIGYPGPTPTMDPHQQPHTGGRISLFLAYDRLTRTTPDLRVEPMLATDWEMAEDGSYLEMNLRDDVVFHDGTPFTAEAVKASVERGQTLAGSAVAPQLDAITEVEVVDDHTVRFHVAEGGPELPAVFSDFAGIMLSPTVLAEGGDDVDLSTVDAGSGAYTLTNFVPNEVTSFERTPDYWNDEVAHLAGVEIEVVQATATRIAALQSGELDLIHVVGPEVENARALADEGAFDVFETAVNISHSLLLRAERPEMSDPRVREAIGAAIDKEAMENLFPDCAVATQPYPAGHWAHDDGIANPYDADRARALLEEVGPIEFDIVVAAGSSSESMALAVQDQLNGLGMDVGIDAVPQSDAVQPFQAGEVDATLSVIVPSVDPAETLDAFFLGGYRLAAEDTEAISGLASDALEPGLSEAERGELYAEIWRTAIVERHWYVPICFTVQGWAYTDALVGLEDLEHVGTGHPIPDRLGVAAG